MGHKALLTGSLHSAALDTLHTSCTLLAKCGLRQESAAAVSLCMPPLHYTCLDRSSPLNARPPEFSYKELMEEMVECSFQLEAGVPGTKSGSEQVMSTKNPHLEKHVR